MPRSKIKTKAHPSLFCTDIKNVMDVYGIKVKSSRQKIEEHAKAAIRQLEFQHQSMLAALSDEELNKTIKQYRAEKGFPAPSSDNSKRSASSHKDDGYVTETSGARSVGGRPAPAAGNRSRPSRRSRSQSNLKTSSYNSSTASGAMLPPTTAYRTGGGRRGRRSSSTSAMGRSQYQTPSNNRMKNFPPITPKVAPNTPMTVLRRPRQGEMVMSLSGSPLLMGSASGVDEMANCNIPLVDGTVLSLVPFKLRKSQVQPAMQYMGPDTYEQLATLRKNLDIVCQLGSKT